MKFYQSQIEAAGFRYTHIHCPKTLTLIETVYICPQLVTLAPSLSGCPYDLELREVRDNSVVLLWAAPLYEGQGPVTGYLVEISQGDQSDEWTAVNEEPITDMYYKVS